MKSELIEFDLFSLDNWRGLTELEKFEAIEEALRKGPIPVLIKDPVTNAKRWAEERNWSFMPSMIQSCVSDSVEFQAVEFDRDDKVIRIKPVGPNSSRLGFKCW